MKNWFVAIPRWRGWRRFGQILLVLLIVGAILVHAVKDWSIRVDETTLGLFLLLFLVLIGLDRIQELSGPGGLKISFRELQATAAAARAETDPESLAEPDPDLAGSRSDQLLDISYQLRNDLAYIRDVILDPNVTPPDPIGILIRLRLDGRLTREQAMLAAQVLALADEALLGRHHETAATRDLLAQVREGLGTIKSGVFDQQVREEIRARDGWTVEDFDQKGRHRPDFFALGPGKKLIISARTATLPKSTLLKTTIKRMSKERPELADAAGSVIVVPNSSNSLSWAEEVKAETKPRKPLEVVKLSELEAAL